jgi:hypothetical protein
LAVLNKFFENFLLSFGNGKRDLARYVTTWSMPTDDDSRGRDWSLRACEVSIASCAADINGNGSTAGEIGSCVISSYGVSELPDETTFRHLLERASTSHLRVFLVKWENPGQREDEVVGELTRLVERRYSISNLEFRD